VACYGQELTTQAHPYAPRLQCLCLLCSVTTLKEKAQSTASVSFTRFGAECPLPLHPLSLCFDQALGLSATLGGETRAVVTPGQRSLYQIGPKERRTLRSCKIQACRKPSGTSARLSGQRPHRAQNPLVYPSSSLGGDITKMPLSSPLARQVISPAPSSTPKLITHTTRRWLPRLHPELFNNI
jgi:hypothetical protein